MKELKFLKRVHKKEPLVSFVVLSYNNEDIIKECLSRIKKQKVNKEIIVIDNGSTDTTPYIAEKYADVVLVNPVRNMAVQRNFGIGLSSGKYVCFTDSDIQLPSNWIQVMLNALEKEGNRMTAGIGSDIQSITRNRITEAQDIAWRLSKPAGVSITQTMTMGNCIFKADVIKKFNFNILFRDTAEDGDMYAQLVKAGYHFLHDGNIAVGHHNPTRFSKLMKQYYYFGKGQYLFNKVWGTRGLLMRLRQVYFPILVVLYAVSVFTDATLGLLTLWFLLPFAIYTIMLLVKVRKFKLNFSVVNGSKFIFHSAGMFLGRIRKYEKQVLC